MNDSNSTLESPKWAIESEYGNFGEILHSSADLSTDDRVRVNIERVDRPEPDGSYGRSIWSICLSAGDTVQIDLDHHPESERDVDPAEMARRISRQLLLAADAFEAAKA